MLKITCFNHEDPIILRGASKAFADGLPVCFCGSEFVKEWQKQLFFCYSSLCVLFSTGRVYGFVHMYYTIFFN
jgi:hypothetical protein